MNAIVACDQSWGIGYKGGLQKRVSADLKRFKSITWGKALIYGCRTLLTHPGEAVLPGRINIILTRDCAREVEGGMVVNSLDELFQIIKQIKRDYHFTDDDFFVTGGAAVYRQLLPYCDRIYVTQFAHSYPADCYFANLDKDPHFKCVSVGEWQEERGVYYRYLLYERQTIA